MLRVPPALDTNYQPSSTAVTHAYRKLTENEEKGKKFHRIERSYGTFVRTFTLPEDVSEEQLKAEFKDGMLFVHLPKTEKSKPKVIDVAVN